MTQDKKTQHHKAHPCSVDSLELERLPFTLFNFGSNSCLHAGLRESAETNMETKTRRSPAALPLLSHFQERVLHKRHSWKNIVSIRAASHKHLRSFTLLKVCELHPPALLAYSSFHSSPPLRIAWSITHTPSICLSLLTSGLLLHLGSPNT